MSNGFIYVVDAHFIDIIEKKKNPGPKCLCNKTDSHDITEILLKVALNTITLALIIKDFKYRRNLIVCQNRTLTKPEFCINLTLTKVPM